MDIGSLKNNHVFYKGYEGEPQIIIFVESDPDMNIHIWEGYFEDIFGNPPLDGRGWKGFTRDYNQLEGTFAENAEVVKINIAEYREDIESYINSSFDYDESSEVVELLSDFLKYAQNHNLTVKATAY